MAVQDSNEGKPPRRKRNRKRSKRRGIYCPEHGCYLDSMSPKQKLYADRPEQLRQRGMSHKKASLLIGQETAVPLANEWLEAFWCECCQETKWYHVCKKEDGEYSVFVAERDLWKQVQGVIHPEGNASVGEFTRKHSRLHGYLGMKQYSFAK